MASRLREKNRKMFAANTTVVGRVTNTDI